MSIPVGWASQRYLQVTKEVAAQQASAAGGLALPGAAAEEGGSFGDTLKQAISQVSGAQDNATEQMSAFLRGEPVELHQVMAATEEAGLALQMLVEVRNKFTEAYRSVINMQS
jgi:flagellar hook-basal body complex protein FliE